LYISIFIQLFTTAVNDLCYSLAYNLLQNLYTMIVRHTKCALCHVSHLCNVVSRPDWTEQTDGFNPAQTNVIVHSS